MNIHVLRALFLLSFWVCASQAQTSAPGPIDSLMKTPPLNVQPSPHPLDPLSAKELDTAVAVLKQSGKLTEGMLFPIMVLNEPPKAEVLAWAEGKAFRREAFAVLLDRKDGKTFEAVIDVANKKIVSWKLVPRVQPSVLIEEFSSPAELVRADPRFIEALKKRGIEDLENVQIDSWAPGVLSPEERKSGRRLIRVLANYRGPNGTNPYFKPIEGVVATVDVAEGKIISVTDTGVVPIAQGNGQLDEASIGTQRAPAKPLRIIQPQGRDFEVHGNQIRWQKWRFRFGMHPREGVVIYDARYHDDGRDRSVLYRASLSEMVVPYGDPDRNWVWRNAFDLGEYGVGRLANTLRPGLDSPENAAFFDATFVDDFGKPYVQQDCVAVWERDAGILWKHFDFDSQHDETRRERELVVQFVATVGNYDYGLNWVFTQNGAIKVEAELTGILLPKGVKEAVATGVSGTGPERFGRLVGRNVVAPNHQHFFNFRLDLDVDGTRNSFAQLDNHRLPRGKGNGYLNAFSLKETRPRKELEARSMINMVSQRFWRVMSADAKNALGQPTAYQLIPGHNSMPYLYPESEVRKRASFIDHHIWITRYAPNEMNAAGYYPNQSNTARGLPEWVSNNESIYGEDIVLWYTMGVTHNPRPEEWPVMSVHRTGFMLVPDGFFAKNPALDVPGR